MEASAKQKRHENAAINCRKIKEWIVHSQHQINDAIERSKDHNVNSGTLEAGSSKKQIRKINWGKLIQVKVDAQNKIRK